MLVQSPHIQIPVNLQAFVLEQNWSTVERGSQLGESKECVEQQHEEHHTTSGEDTGRSTRHVVE